VRGKFFGSAGLIVVLVLLHATDSTATDLTLPVGGFVSVELVYSEAVFSNTLALVAPAVAIERSGCETEYVTGLSGVVLGSEKPSQRGCRVVLDADPSTDGVQPFSAGTKLEFNLCAQIDADPACEYVWSSDPAENPDSGTEHVHTTALYPADYPGHIFEMAWEDRPDAPPDFNDLIANIRIHLDSDGDGLWDDWEKFGIDTDADGTINLDLPNLLPVDLNGDGNTNGPNEKTSPTHKDVFLEIDYMDCAIAGGDCPSGDTHSHKPKKAAVDAVVKAFDDAGITLHVDLSNPIPHANTLSMGGGTYSTIKTDPANFGTHNPRRYAFHYAVFGHFLLPSSAAGAGEVGGNDFAVALGGSVIGQGDLDNDGLPDENVGTVQTQASVLMHELGHNLGLEHGGDEQTNSKPNYISIMNYMYHRGIGPTDPDGPGGPMEKRVDYSSSKLPTLDETDLEEQTGVGDGTDTAVYWCPDWTRTEGAGAGPIDWNCDGDNGLGGDKNLAIDISGDRACVRAGGSPWVLKATPSGDDVPLRGYFIADGPDRTCDTTKVDTDVQQRPVGDIQEDELTGHDDWANLKLDFQSNGQFQDDVYTDVIVDVGLRIESSPEANAGVDQTLECGAYSGATVVLDGRDSIDADSISGPNDDIVLFEWIEDLGLPSESPLGSGETLEVALPIGTHGITLRVTDSLGAEDLDEVVITVVDTTPPQISVDLSPATLWPPDHRLVDVSASVLAQDHCGPTAVVLISVTSSEPDNAPGLGDGDTNGDIQGAALGTVDFELQLRAERAGRGPGRSYTAVYHATDPSGNESSAAGSVEVPHH
jgi:hypothetical protein